MDTGKFRFGFRFWFHLVLQIFGKWLTLIRYHHVLSENLWFQEKWKMLTLQVYHSSFNCPNDKVRSFGNVFLKTGGGLVTVVSKKRDFTEKPKPNGKRPLLQIKVPNTILARSAIAVLGLGFIDAG